MGREVTVLVPSIPGRIVTSMTARILTLIVLVACSSPDAPVDPVDGGIDASLPPSGVETIDLGPVTSATPVTLMIPERTLGFHVVIEVDGSTGSETVGIERVVGPAGAAVVESFVPVGHVAPTAQSAYGIAALSIPQTSATSAIPVMPGTWMLTFSVPPGRTARARAYVRTTIDGEFHGGTLDVRVYIPDGLMISDPTPLHAVSAATAATDPSIVARLDSFFMTLEQLFELGRGRVEFIALPASFATLPDDASRVSALNATSAGSELSVHLILTSELTLFGSPVWGSSPGIPGSSATTGHPLAAVVVDVSLGFPAIADGMTMVHELGHFMGLFHTTEQNRAYHDPISDTPECAPGAATCPDGHNIMFSTFYGASGGIGLTTSPHQRRVIWGSPLYAASAPAE